MFDFIRSHQRLMQLLLLVLIVPSFVFFGVQGYERMSQQSQSIAKVGGQPISQGDLDNAQREQIARMRQTYGASIDAAMFDTPEARAQTLDGLISQRVLMVQAQKASLGTSDRKLQETIMAIPALQVDGKFNQDRYEALLAQQGMTPAIFESRMRDDLAIQQLDAAIETSVIVPKRVVDTFAGIVAQRREVKPLTFKVADFVSQVKLADDAVQKDYDAHPNDYMTPETAKVEYVVLSADSLAKQATVPDKDLHDAYDQNAARYTLPEQRRASHILVAVAKDASDADRAKAKAKAEDILKKVKANPADFAKLAKQFSDDPGSAANGGDLDYLGRGATVPPFEASLFALKDKEISDLVQTDFGYHIIELTGIKPAQVKPFDTVKGDIAAELGKQLAQKKFTDAAEGFANGVYEQGDSLAPTAQKFGLQVQTADQVTRTPTPGVDTTGALNDPLKNTKLLAALFSADSIKNHHNTEAVETSPGTLVSARIVGYSPAARRPLAEVASGIKARLTDAEARKLADTAGQAALAKLRTGDPAATAGRSFGASTVVSRTERTNVPADALTEIFRADASKLPAYAGLTTPEGDYAIYQIASVSSAPVAEGAGRMQLTQTIAKQLGTIEFNAYLADLRRRIKVQVSPPYGDLIDKQQTTPAKSTPS
jgi:peptidyl-prolyl cis-trans isomerase D